METNEINRVRVEIGGAEYTLRGQASEERLMQVAKMVDRVMQHVAAANPNLDTKRVAVLTALNIADEYHKLRQQYDELLALLEERTGSPSKR